MFTIESKNYKMKVRFMHYLDPREVTPGTDCFIIVSHKHLNFIAAFGAGSTNVHPNDQFDRALGRKLSLARAIQDIIPNRSADGLKMRRAIWEAYFEKTTNPRRGA